MRYFQKALDVVQQVHELVPLRCINPRKEVRRGVVHIKPIAAFHYGTHAIASSELHGRGDPFDHSSEVRVACLTVTMLTLYACLLFIIFGRWWTFHAPMDEVSVEEPLLLNREDNELERPDMVKFSRLKAEVQENGATSWRKDPTGPPVMEAFLSEKFRSHGDWVAKNAKMVLAVAIVLIVILCLGLIRLNVETRSEKLWVSLASKALEEKEFFDNHLGMNVFFDDKFCNWVE